MPKHSIQVIHQICTSSLNMHTLYETTEEEEEDEEEPSQDLEDTNMLVENNVESPQEMNADDFLNKHRKNKS